MRKVVGRIAVDGRLLEELCDWLRRLSVGGMCSDVEARDWRSKIHGILKAKVHSQEQAESRRVHAALGIAGKGTRLVK